MKIIGIIGIANSGKDTVADYISNKLTDTTTLALAYPIKQKAMKLLGIDNVELLNYHKDSKIPYHGVNVRKLLQEIGDGSTNMDPGIYADMLLDKLYSMCSLTSSKVFIISDIRTPEELETLNRYAKEYMVTLKVSRDIKDRVTANHRSESQVSELVANYTVDNNGTLKELYGKIDKILEQEDIH